MTRTALLLTLFVCTVVALAATSARSASAGAPGRPEPDISEFVAFCPFSHRLNDDPIVFPGEPGRSHSHEFFGSTVVDALTTLEDLLNGDTTCDPLGDRSSYWVPTLFDPEGQPIATEQETFYYLAHVDNPLDIQLYPLGLKVIAGNAMANGPEENGHYKWSCLGSAISSTETIVECPEGSKLELLLNFPDCWDGKNLDSPDHKSHMAYSAGGQCPDSHPVPVPALQYKLRYDTRGGPDFYLDSGPGYTAHGDFFNAWDPSALANRVLCLRFEIKCGPEGYLWGTELNLPFLTLP
jgi:hypothetical protein